LESALNKVMQLFRYINGKDVFEAFYKKDLAKRLLLNKTASQDLERSMISRLKTECGADFTSKLEGMFKDMSLSKDVMDVYETSDELKARVEAVEKRVQKMADAGSEGSDMIQGVVEMHIHVLTTGFWPTYPPSKIRLPAPLQEEQKVFEHFYHKKYSGRKMMWQHSLGVVSVRAHFPKGRKELALSCYQASVLMLFNGMGEGDKLLFKDILSSVEMDVAELKVTLQSLACGKVRVIKKRPKGKEVEETDHFIVAHDFKDKRRRIKINQIQIKETVKEKTEVHESVARDRIHVIDAAIVRIMKTRTKLRHNELITQIYNQLKFPAETSSLKKRIESLIDREYIERDEQDTTMYNYLA
jgi:cullin-4